MNTLLIIALVYLAYIITWLVINLTAYFFSIAFKRKGVLKALTTLSVFGLQIFNFLIGVGIFWLGITLLLNREFLWLIVLIFFGAGVIGGLLSYLQIPFLLISAYFTEKLEDIDFNENVATAEVLDEHKRVIAKTEGNTAISRRLAIYFVIFFAFNLTTALLFPDEEKTLKGLDYILTPAFQVIGGTIIFAIPYMIYHKIKHRTFFPKDKRYFFIQVWKLNLIIFTIIAVLAMLFVAVYS